MAYFRGLLILVFVGSVGACDTATLVKPTSVPSSERGATAEGNRFFFIGGHSLFELVAKPDGTNEAATVMQRSDCKLSGLAAAGSKLYMTCTAFGSPNTAEKAVGVTPTIWSDLIRVDLRKATSDPAHVRTTTLEGPGFFPNGMALDQRGDIYISNSYSSIASLASMEPHPAIVRVSVINERTFQIEKVPVLSEKDGGSFPNGVQIQGNRLWLASGSALYEAKLGSLGLESVRIIYTIAASRMFDDFAVLPDNVLAIAEIPTPGFSGAATWPPVDDPSQLTFISVGPEAIPDQAGKVIGEHKFEYPIAPSSATLVMDREGPALYVTDYFFGGLYRVGS